MTSNPIETRLEVLREQWGEFIELPAARMLHWLVADDEAGVVDVFLELEAHEEGGQFPDLFLRFDQPFDVPDHYGFLVRTGMVEQYEHDREAMREEGLPTDWVAPIVAAQHNATQALAETCVSFAKHHADLFEHLVLVLEPRSIVDAQAWQLWLRTFLHMIAPTTIRVMVLDHPRVLSLGSLANAEPALVHTQVANLDMPTALEEISTQAGNLDAPGGKFRQLWVKLVNALGKGKQEEAERLGTDALVIATAQGWLHLVVTVHYALGSGLLQRSDFAGAISRYTLAERAAAEAEQRGEPYGTGLRLKARLAIGSALVGAASYAQAAMIYVEAAPMAEALGDQMMLLECWRMASYCYEMQKLFDPAWDCGIKALKVGQDMDAEARKASTLPWVGEGLLRIAAASSYGPYTQGIERQMQEILGSEWRPRASSPAN